MGEAARLNFLAQQNAAFLTTARTMRVSLHIAMMRGEVAPETLHALFDDFMGMAAACQQEEAPGPRSPEVASK